MYVDACMHVCIHNKMSFLFPNHCLQKENSWFYTKWQASFQQSFESLCKQLTFFIVKWFGSNEWGYVRKRGSTNGRHNVTCRKSPSNQNKDGDRIIIPAGQRALAMKNIALRCKRVCGIFDLPKFSKCVSSKSKNKQTQKNTSSRHANILWIRDILRWYFF